MARSKISHGTLSTLSGALFCAAMFCAVLAASVACRGGREAQTVGGAVFDISPELIAAGAAKVAGPDRADTMVNLGTLREGQVVRYDARLRNAGAEPLVIKGITTTCGCTSVEYDKKPIAPDAAGSFSFSLDSRGMWGLQMKLIEISTSAADRPYTIMVMARVEENRD